MTLKQIALFAALFGMVFSNSKIYAKEEMPRLKSVTAAWVMGLDPIPGDALFYAGKPTQGTVNSILGLIGGIGFGFALKGTLNQCDHTNTTGEGTFFNCGGLGAAPAALTLASASLYLGALIWDGIGGISGVNRHNERVRNQQASIWRSVQPTVSVATDGAFIGAEFKF